MECSNCATVNPSGAKFCQECGTKLALACPSCSTVEWWSSQRMLDPAEGMARLFGQYDLVDAIPALRAPAAEVLVYRAPNRRARKAFAAFPAGAWLEAHPGLWLTHDGEHLLLAPADPILAENLVRNA